MSETGSSEAAVADASAILALLEDEPGAEIVLEAADSLIVSAVNLSEVVAKLADRGNEPARIRAMLAAIAPDVIPFDEAQAHEAGLLRPETRRAGLSFGDRACIALGRRLRLPVLTAERRWRDLELGVDVRLIR